MRITYTYFLQSLVFLSLIIIGYTKSVAQPIWKNRAFAIYRDSVTQGKFTGKATSALELTSNYKSLASESVSPAITFKFAINGKDVEMKSGTDHHFVCLADNGTCETPLIKFGIPFVDSRSVPDNTFLRPSTDLKVKLDMRKVLDSFEKNGFYTTATGEKIYKQDFKSVAIAGGTAPLHWNFVDLVSDDRFMLKDNDKDGIYEATIKLNNPADEKDIQLNWKPSKNTEAFPQYTSEYPLSDAIYNMSIGEMINAVEPDSTFRTGKEWSGVWTRDISYSIILSMAYLQPKVAKYSLLRKVKNGKIIQDTGTGGAYPASTDRIIWAVAAWELYKTTGDKAWLKQANAIITSSLEDDLKNAYDKETGLFKGESSFLDWREQTYPKWMQPVDIYESECLGTNAVFYQANIVLADMATALGDKQSAVKYKQIANGIKAGINKYLWLPEKGYYAQYLYGRNAKIVSPRAEALGEALVVLFGIADAEKQKRVIESTPVMDFGIPCIYPQIPGIPPYHNNAVWPFVQSYYALAAAKVGNKEAVMESIAAIYRPAALWVTNKENFVASSGDFAGTQINSSNMLWSLSGNIALVHKIIFGINLNENGITFKPFVPSALAGKRSLTNFTYRDAILDIEMEGHGNLIKSFLVDGKQSAPVISGLKGRHNIKIVLANLELAGKVNTVEHYVSPESPIVSRENLGLTWNSINGANEYRIIKNGKEVAKVNKTSYSLPNESFAEYQVIALDETGVESFASEPLIIAGDSLAAVYEIESVSNKASLPYKGFSGEGFVEISKTKNKTITVPVTIATAGRYTIDFRYANGNGPTNTENKCAIRTLNEGTKILGTVVMPQRGSNEWSSWGYTNPIQASLTKGKHFLTISFESYNENMNGEINQAMLDNMRIIKMD